MSNFLPNRIKDLKGWIPETDIDGLDVDVRKGYVSETENIVYENGFFRCDKEPVTGTHFTPTADETIIGARLFYHDDRGNVFVYVIWNTDTSQLYFYVKDDLTSSYIYLPNTLTYNSTPETVNFAEFENQLKINTDATLIIVDSSNRYSHANFTLQWEEDSNFTYAPYDPTEPRHYEGWYAHVRYLGVSHQKSGLVAGADILDTTIDFDSSVSSGKQSFEIVGVNAYVVLSSVWATSWIYAGADAITLGNFTNAGEWSFQTNQYAKKIQFRLKMGSTGGDATDTTIVVKGGVTTDVIYSEILSDTKTPLGWVLVTVDIPYSVDTASGFYVIINSEYAAVDEFFVDYNSETDAVLVSVNSDGQRALVDEGGINAATAIRIYKDEIDWRIRSYELYTPDSESDIWYLQKTYDVAGLPGSWTTVVPTYYEQDLEVYEQLSVTTLNFNYGLGATVYPYKIGPAVTYVVGDNIFNEVYYKNRSYYVNGDKNIYMSHIAGNAKLQPDSFPYSEDVEFGFIYGDNSDEQLKGIFISSLDELIILSATTGLVYTIQHSQLSVYRKIKAINGSVGLGALESVVTSNTGKPVAEVVLWCNSRGICYYGGGVNQPIVITDETLYNYWKSFYTVDIIGAYNPMRNEALFIKDDLAIVLDLNTQTWRKIRFDNNVVEFVGIIDSKPYFLLDNDTYMYLDDTVSARMDGALVTHYTANYTVDDRGSFIPLGEMTDKYMQELYMSMHVEGVNTGAPIGIYYDIIADGNVITPRVYFSGQIQFEKTIAPLLVRYRQVKIRLIISNANFAIKEFGWTHNTDTDSIIRQVHPDISSTGFGSNFGNDFGVHL